MNDRNNISLPSIMGNICWLKVSSIKDIDIALINICKCKENNTKDTKESADL